MTKMASKGGFDIFPYSPAREIVIDAGYLGSGRHVIYGMVEVDVTRALKLKRKLSEQSGIKISFTAFIVASLSRAIESNPRVQAYRDWRRRHIVFHDVDVVTMIEPEPGAVAIPHIIRSANRKNVLEITREIRSIQDTPGRSEQYGPLLNLAPRAPRLVRLFVFWLLKVNPHWFKRFEGTVVLTSVGMFGESGGWGIGFLPTHTTGITVGGMSRKPGVSGGQIGIRDYLNITLSFDHDIVDGAPAARFARDLIDLIESAELLAEVAGLGVSRVTTAEDG
jgi:pyruvate/2-oxoglutarate dehydrogenase complex dihydrolipoamide acyltransferase (E2) component